MNHKDYNLIARDLKETTAESKQVKELFDRQVKKTENDASKVKIYFYNPPMQCVGLQYDKKYQG